MSSNTAFLPRTDNTCDITRFFPETAPCRQTESRLVTHEIIHQVSYRSVIFYGYSDGAVSSYPSSGETLSVSNPAREQFNQSVALILQLIMDT